MLTERGSEKKESILILIISVLAVLLPVALYSLRAFDDNRLVSWKWVFGLVGHVRVFAALLISIPVSYVLSRRSLPGPLLLFLVSFISGTLFWREPEVIVDASRYFTQAKHLEVYGVRDFLVQWGKGIDAWTDMPLVPFLYGLVFKFAGEARLFIQMLDTAMFSMTVSLVSMIGRELWDKKTGDAAGALLLAMPYVYTQVPLMLVDISSMFFLTLAIFMFMRALDRGGAGLVLMSSASNFLAVFSKYSLWLMLSVLGVIFIVRSREATARIFRRGIAVALVSTVLVGTALLFYHDVIFAQTRLLLDYQRPGLRRWTESFFSTFFFQIHPFVTAGALYSTYVALRKKDLKYLIAAWLVLLLLFLQIKRIRYLLPVFPMLALVSSFGIAAIGKERAGRFLILTSVFSSLALGVFAYMPFLEKNSLVNLRDAGRFLDTMKSDAVEVLTLPQKSKVNPAVAVPLLDLYTHKRLLYHYEFKTHLSPGQIQRSSFRFTWEYRNPAYYSSRDVFTKEKKRFPLAVIHGGSEPVPYGLRDSYKPIRNFNISEGLYRFRPFVLVCAPEY